MKKTAFLFILITIPVWIFFYIISDKGVELDPMTEKALKEELETTKISKSLLSSIETLDLSHRNLTSIKGMENFTNLKELNLAGNVLTDVSELSELENLITLDLSFNQLNILTLKSTGIESLNLEGNRFSSIPFVAPMKKLSDLNIRANSVSDLTPLEGLSQLRALNIRGNQVKSLDVLVGKQMLMDLNARNNQITSIKPLRTLPLHERLYLTGNGITDLTLIKEKLKTIDDIDFEIDIPLTEFRTPSGIYTEPFKLELRTAKRHQVYYTLDGSKPTLRSTKYTKPIEISKEVMLEQPLYSNTKTSPNRDGFSFLPEDVKKAVTVTAASYINGNFSEPLSYTYVLDPEVFSSGLPVVSLTMDPRDLFDDHGGIYVPGDMYEEGYNKTGNYYQKGKEFEKVGSMEFMLEDGTMSFRQTIGLRINGSYTRILPQKSLRIYPRSDYGQSRIYSKIFEDVPYYEYNILVLRSSGNDNDSTLIRDGLMHELIKNRGLDVQGFRPSIVLINGEYWGIHNIREKFDEDYIDIKYNVKENDLVMLSVYSESGIQFKVDVGKEKDKVTYTDMVQYVEENDMNQKEHVTYINTLMDIDNFLDYVAVEVYYGNTDSFHNNMTVWRKKVEYNPDAPLGHDGRWRWMLFDLDWGMGYGLLGSEGDPITHNMLGHLLSDDKSVKLFKYLMDNEELQERFIGKMMGLINTNFEPVTVHSKIDELAAKIRPEIPKSIARWENIESLKEWEKNIEVLHDFAERRPEIIKAHLRLEFGVTDEQLNEMNK